MTSVKSYTTKKNTTYDIFYHCWSTSEARNILIPPQNWTEHDLTHSFLLQKDEQYFFLFHRNIVITYPNQVHAVFLSLLCSMPTCQVGAVLKTSNLVCNDKKWSTGQISGHNLLVSIAMPNCQVRLQKHSRNHKSTIVSFFFLSGFFFFTLLFFLLFLFFFVLIELTNWASDVLVPVLTEQLFVSV